MTPLEVTEGIVGRFREDAGPWTYSLTGTESLARKADTTTRNLAGGVAVGLAIGGLILALDALSKFASNTPDNSVVIGAWAIAGLLFLAAGLVAAIGLRNWPMSLAITRGQAAPTAAPAAAPAADPAATVSAAQQLLAAAAALPANDTAGFAAAVAAVNGAAVALAATAAPATTSKTQPATTATTVTPVSPKVVAAGLAGALSTAFWTVAAATFWKHTLDATAIGVLAPATTTIVATAAAYIRTDVLRVAKDVGL
jgi:hypothetical protein